MSEAETTHASAEGSGHDHDAGHGDEDTAAAEPLGPVDVTTWAYALAGSALGILTIVALYVARGA